MARVKRGVSARARHKKVLKLAKGYRHGRKNIFRLANQAVNRAKKNAYIGRKQKKRFFRSLWIIRINAACKKNGIKYSELIKKLQGKNGGPNRKQLCELAQNNPEEFTKIVETAKNS